MILVDDHCHLMHELYKKDLDEVIERSKKAGVRAIVCSGVNTPTNREALQISNKYDIVQCSAGFYPLDILGLGADSAGMTQQEGKMDLDKEFDWVKQHKDKIVAIGEAGLDLHWNKDEKTFERQKQNFRKVIEFTEKIKKPIIVHSRRAEKQCIEMLETSKIKKIVMHSLEARKSLLRKAIDNGYNFSIPANIVKSPQFQILTEMANINQLLTETDGPWLSPDGKRNEPKNVLEAVKKIAEIKKFTLEDTANSIWLNYQRIYTT